MEHTPEQEPLSLKIKMTEMEEAASQILATMRTTPLSIPAQVPPEQEHITK